MFKISSIALLAAVIATATPASAADATTDYASVADYLIVGGGPAGLVLAEQLSRSGKKQVVLLEAGPDEQNSSVVNSKLLPAREIMSTFLPRRSTCRISLDSGALLELHCAARSQLEWKRTLLSPRPYLRRRHRR